MKLDYETTDIILKSIDNLLILLNKEDLEELENNVRIKLREVTEK